MKSPERIANCKRKGFVLIAFTLSLMLLLGAAGLTFDLGRMYIARNEAQSFCDAAALYAVWKLNGKHDGITAARAAALATPKLWAFGTRPFDPARTTVEFAKTFAGPWIQDPSPAADYVYARVSTSVPLPMFLMPVVTGQLQATIAARATAKQLPLAGTPNNIFPFAPFWMVPDGSTGPAGSSEPTPEDPYGMIPALTGRDTPWKQQGGIYTLRGPSQWNDAAADMCPNDATQQQYDYRKASGIPERGFIWDTHSMDDIKNAIQGNAVPQDGHSINIGDNVETAGCEFCMTEGTRQVAAHAIQDRVTSDSNATAQNYSDYVDLGGLTSVNSRRVVVVPIVTGVCGSYDGGSVVCPNSTIGPGQFGANTVVGFASFFLLPASSYAGNANSPICAEYVGPWVANSAGGGATSGSTGGSVPMLVE